jgi:hypothetical protein
MDWLMRRGKQNGATVSSILLSLFVSTRLYTSRWWSLSALEESYLICQPNLPRMFCLYGCYEGKRTVTLRFYIYDLRVCHVRRLPGVDVDNNTYCLYYLIQGVFWGWLPAHESYRASRIISEFHKELGRFWGCDLSIVRSIYSKIRNDERIVFENCSLNAMKPKHE